jgi:hypothetical protein
LLTVVNALPQVNAECQMPNAELTPSFLVAGPLGALLDSSDDSGYLLGFLQ